MCANLLSSEDKMMQLAKQMMAIAQYYNFDGWLVNIENPINVSGNLINIDFVSLVPSPVFCSYSMAANFLSCVKNCDLKFN